MFKKEKELHVVAAKYILGENITKKITGKSYVINSYIKLLESSKSLYEAIKEEKSIETISILLDEKRNCVKEFKELTGINWRL